MFFDIHLLNFYKNIKTSSIPLERAVKSS